MIKTKQHMKETPDVTVVKNLKKSFEGKTILRDISLQLKEGENMVVLGRSGAGKSVLIKSIVRLLEPDEGEINVLGKDILSLKSKELRELRKHIGYLFQGGALYDSMTVRENLMFPLVRNFRHFSKDDMAQLVIEALSSVNLLDAIDKMPSELSGGMKKRIGLARTIIMKPGIILYDEPTTGLDPVSSKNISQLILDIQRKYKTSSIVVTHDIDCVRIIADRILFLKDGLIHFEGSLEDFERSKDPDILDFFN